MVAVPLSDEQREVKGSLELESLGMVEFDVTAADDTHSFELRFRRGSAPKLELVALSRIASATATITDNEAVVFGPISLGRPFGGRTVRFQFSIGALDETSRALDYRFLLGEADP